MIHSMTGFGQSTFELGGLIYAVEVRAVNHRHLDARVRLPRQMSEQETRIKSLVQARLARGKVDLTVTQVNGGASPGELQVDREIARQYVEAASDLRENHHLAGTLDVAELLALPGVARFVEISLPGEELEQALDDAVIDALEKLVAMRLTEGRALAAELAGRLDKIQCLVAVFEERAETVLELAKQKLERRMEQIQRDTGLFDEARLHQEIVIAADRLDIREEIVRLRSHVEHFRTIVAEADEGSPVGRRLDFLLQEMGREGNTIGSKANDAPLAREVVELKAELERVREQVQNVE